MAGCQTGTGLRPSAPGLLELAAAETFAVAPLKSGVRAIPLTRASLEHATRQAIVQEMELKGYRLAEEGESADFELTPWWVMTQVDNPLWQSSGGNVDTVTRIPSTVPAATLRVAARADESMLWYGDSGWPLLVETFSIARLEQAVGLALSTFPSQDARDGGR